MNDTLQYYNTHADAFAQDTQQSDLGALYAPFLQRVVPGGHILDLGCGAGRDSAQFLAMGYRVTAVDGAEALCGIAQAHIGQEVHCMLFADISWQNEFDGVWACSSLLHCTYAELPGILTKVAHSLKAQGVLYVSFKYGDFEGMRNGRYFTDLTEARLAALLEQVPDLQLAGTSISGDVRPGRAQEQWLNAVLVRV